MMREAAARFGQRGGAARAEHGRGGRDAAGNRGRALRARLHGRRGRRGVRRRGLDVHVDAARRRGARARGPGGVGDARHPLDRREQHVQHVGLRRPQGAMAAAPLHRHARRLLPLRNIVGLGRLRAADDGAPRRRRLPPERREDVDLKLGRGGRLRRLRQRRPVEGHRGSPRSSCRVARRAWRSGSRRSSSASARARRARCG